MDRCRALHRNFPAILCVGFELFAKLIEPLWITNVDCFFLHGTCAPVAARTLDLLIAEEEEAQPEL